MHRKLQLFTIGCVVLLAVGTPGIAQGPAALPDAAEAGDTARVRSLLEDGAEVNASQTNGSTALHWAVYRNDAALVQELVDRGADVQRRTREGVSPLFLASLYGDPDIIGSLLDGGADPNEVGPNTETPIMLAARNGNPAAIRTLIGAGADPNAVETVRGTTALMWAVEQRHSDAVAALLDGGADFSARTAPAGLPRRYMANRVNTERVLEAQERLRVAAAEGLTQREYQALREEAEGDESGGALGFGLDTIVTLVLDQLPPGGNVEALLVDFRDQFEGFGIDFEELQAAVRARLAGDEEVDADSPDSVNETVDDTAAADSGDDDDAAGPQAGLVGGGGGGLTPLIYAAREGCLECARLLVEAGADVKAASNYGWTPLLTATNNRWYRLGSYLISQGADANIANMGGMTPLYLATDNRNIEGGDYPVPSADMDDLEYIRLLLESGADPNHQVSSDTETRTIFTMQWFFESGATAFVRASQSGDTALMRLLLEYGADPLIPTDYGDTALSAAAGIGWVEGVTYEWSPAENLEAIQMLLDQGADPNAANQDGRTPLMGAAMKGRIEVIEALVEAGAELGTRDNGSRDTDKTGSRLAGHTWQAIDYADGLVRVGVQSAVSHPEVAERIREMMIERDMPVPPPNRVVESICIVEICKEMTYDSLAALEGEVEP